ncbi:RNA-dependent RNA polymerase family protein [Nocardia salmonicida]|uniref:hypothetical protein n=1 Tax=Nocardia salmonicida TaxID=53431 RepID=UPI00363C6BB7
MLANIALTILDAHFVVKWEAHTSPYQRKAHRKRGGATYRNVRYADDPVIVVAFSKVHADALWDEVAQVIAPLGLRLWSRSPRQAHNKSHRTCSRRTCVRPDEDPEDPARLPSTW